MKEFVAYLTVSLWGASFMVMLGGVIFSNSDVFVSGFLIGAAGFVLCCAWVANER